MGRTRIYTLDVFPIYVVLENDDNVFPLYVKYELYDGNYTQRSKILSRREYYENILPLVRKNKCVLVELKYTLHTADLFLICTEKVKRVIYDTLDEDHNRIEKELSADDLEQIKVSDFIKILEARY